VKKQNTHIPDFSKKSGMWQRLYIGSGGASLCMEKLCTNGGFLWGQHIWSENETTVYKTDKIAFYDRANPRCTRHEGVRTEAPPPWLLACFL